MEKKLTARQIVRWIKEGLIEQDRRRGEEHRGPTGQYFYAREVGGCSLRAYLRRTECPADRLEGHRFQYLGRLGDAIERIALDATGVASGLRWERQARATKTYSSSGKQCTIVGKCDALCPGTCGLEVKSCNTETFDECRSLKAVYVCRPDYPRQCLVYTWLFAVPVFYLIVVDRNDSRFRCFPIKENKRETERYLDSLAKTEEAIKKKDPPNPSPGYGCYVCPYTRHCPAWQDPQETPTSI